MTMLTYVPGPPLSDFVRMLWSFDDYKTEHAMERVLPDGSMDLVFDLRYKTGRIYEQQNPERVATYHGAVMIGAHSDYFLLDTEEPNSVIGVHFKPGGAFPFFGTPASELSNAQISLDLIWGSRAGEIREQLLEAPSPDVRFRVLEQALLAQAGRSLELRPEIGYAIGEFSKIPNMVTISDVTDRIGLSARRFIQLFHERVGLTPKVFCRVRRFNCALQSIHKENRVEWAAVAADCGYFDQAHFIRDFRAFSGLTPTAYLARRGEHLNHVPVR